MNILVLAAVQAMFSSPTPEADLPRFGDLDRVEPMERQPIYPWLGIQPRAVWTSFDSDLDAEDTWGFGADVTVTLDYGTNAFLGFRAGYLGWNTRVETRFAGEHSAQFRQYRLGVFGQFPFRFMEFSIGANVGAYRFRREGNNDTAGFFEFEASLGGRPNNFIWIGVVAMQSFSSSDFNHSDEHFLVNYSIGPAFELRF